MSSSALLFNEAKFSDAKKFLIAVKPWWGRYVERFDVVPISVPLAGDDVRCTVRIADNSLTMYVDVEYVDRASLPELAGSIEHELQRSRRRFDDRRLAMTADVTDEYWNVATRMEVASALRDEYARSALSTERTYQEDNLYNMLLKSPVFDNRLLEKYEIDSLPVADATWMPEMFDMISGLSAEEYAAEIVRRATADNTSDDDEPQNSSPEDGEENDGSRNSDQNSDPSDDQNSDSKDGEKNQNAAEQQNSDDSDEHSEDDRESHDEDSAEDATADADSENGEQPHDDGAGDSESGEREPSEGSGDDNDSGAADSNKPQRFDDSSSSQSSTDSDAEQFDGTTPPADVNADSDSEVDDPAGNEYQQLNTDNGQGQGRSGSWQSENEQRDDHDALDDETAPTLDTAEGDAAKSTAIEESKQLASSDARTDRASSGTQGQIGDSADESSIAQQLQSLRQEYPVLDFDASDFRPEIYDDEYSSDPDEIEQIERELERSEREAADEELIEDVKNAAAANSLDPLAPIQPSVDDIDIADYEQKRRNIHWTDMFAEIVSSRVQSVVTRGSDEFSYQRRNPNQSLLGPILMGGISYNPVVYVVFDTSPSMRGYVESQKATLADIFANIEETMNATVRWFAADVNITRTGETDRLDEDVLAAFRYNANGTNFCDDLNALVGGDFALDEESFDEPDVLIVVSDMEFRWSGLVAESEPSDTEFIPVLPKRNTLRAAQRMLHEKLGVPGWIFQSDNLVEMV